MSQVTWLSDKAVYRPTVKFTLKPTPICTCTFTPACPLAVRHERLAFALYQQGGEAKRSLALSHALEALKLSSSGTLSSVAGEGREEGTEEVAIARRIVRAVRAETEQKKKKQQENEGKQDSKVKKKKKKKKRRVVMM